MSHKQTTQSQSLKAKEVDWRKVMNAAGPYPMEAFDFVRDGLNYTVGRIHSNPKPEMLCGSAVNDRHISGQQLCLGLRDYAIQQYGMLAPVVLSHWNVRRTDDFGRIVFAMIAEGVMSRTEDDCIDDFRMVYDFEEAFSQDQLLVCMA